MVDDSYVGKVFDQLMYYQLLPGSAGTDYYYVHGLRDGFKIEDTYLISSQQFLLSGLKVIFSAKLGEDSAKLTF